MIQETDFRLFIYLRGCRATSNGEFVSWALTVAQSSIADHFRRNVGAFSDILLREELVNHIDHAAQGAWVDASESTISKGAVDLVAATMRAYALLPADIAELLYERIVRSLSWPEIALRFGTTTAGAKRRFQRAQRRIRGAVLGHISGLEPDRREAAEAALRQHSGTRSADASSARAERVGQGDPGVAGGGSKRQRRR